MFAKLNHLAIVSRNYALNAKFYEAAFGMSTAVRSRAGNAVVVGDGYVGLNINPRVAGRMGRLDHFGIEVEDVETVFDRMRRNYPRLRWLKRPSNRPFAGITAHDVDGNIFDLSQRNMANRRDVYVEMNGVHPRHVSHFAVRTMNPAEVADFYRDVFELEPCNKKEGDENHYLTDGHIKLVIMPWRITDYEGTGICGAAMDHVGFTVEDMDAFKRDLTRITDANPLLAPLPVGTGPEGAARLELTKRSCPLCQHHMADLDGIWLSASVQ